MKRSPAAAFAALVLTVLAGCAALGIPSVPKPESFNEKVAAGYTLVTSARSTGTALLNAHVISADDAENVLEQTDNLRQGVEVARAMSDAAASGSKIDAVLAGLVALDSYLCVRKHGTYDRTARKCVGGTP